MVRDRDLLKWGKVGSIFMSIFSLLLFTGSASGYYIASKILGAVFFKASGFESSLLAKVDEDEVKNAILVLTDLNMNYAETILELIRIVCILAIALASFALNLSVLLWRSNELSHELNFAKLDNNQTEVGAEQVSTCKNNLRVSGS